MGAPGRHLRIPGLTIGTWPVLGGFALDIAGGQTTVLLGSSGSGKSSLLRLVAGLLPMPAGATLTATDSGPVQGRLAGEVAEPEPANGQYAVLALRLQPGDSGGGVFDAASGCLIGIISMRDPAQPGHSWLVRAAVIRAFLAAEQSECPPDDGTRQCRLSPPDAFR